MAAVLIKDEKLEEFYRIAQERGWLEEQDSDFPPDHEIPQWQMEETLRRQATTRPEDYIPWTELRKKYDRREL